MYVYIYIYICIHGWVSVYGYQPNQFQRSKKSAAQESARNAETTPPRCAAPPTPETPCCCESGAHRLSGENWKFGTMDLCG